jgi:hypothetical protein
MSFVTTTGILSATSFNSTSDVSTKTDIKDLSLEYSKQLIKKINPVSYTFKQDPCTKRFGFIAQEVEKSLGGEKLGLHYRDPEGKNHQSICYQELIAPLVKIINDLLNKVSCHGESEIKNGFDKTIVTLPEYTNTWYDFTINVTPIGQPRNLGVSRVKDGYFEVYGPPGEFFWTINGKNKNKN